MKTSQGLLIVPLMVVVVSGAVRITHAQAQDGGPLNVPPNFMQSGNFIVDRSANPAQSTVVVGTLTMSPKLVKAAYMGVGITPAEATLRSQLKLEDGVGLVVNYVDEAGPANAAGVKQHDVIHKVGDQFAINIKQFEVLMRMRKPGDEVELTVIRQAQPIKITVKLIEKEVPELSWFQDVTPSSPMTRTEIGTIHFTGSNTTPEFRLAPSITPESATPTRSGAGTLGVGNIRPSAMPSSVTVTKTGTGMMIFSGSTTMPQGGVAPSTMPSGQP